MNVTVKEQMYEGKAKKVFATDDPGLVLVDYKDDATAFNGLKKGTITGKGAINNQMTNYLMGQLEKAGVPTHFVEELSERETVVKKVTIVPLEVIIRNISAGSFAKRYGVEEGIVFDPPYTEVTLKDDEQGDPLISERLCIMKGLLAPGQYDEALGILVKVGEVLKKELAGMGLTLIDFKIEVGYDENGKMYVVDEITPDIWRVRDEQGNIPNQIDCAKLILEKI